MNEQEPSLPFGADPAPSEPAYPPEARWWKGRASSPGFDQLFSQPPPGVAGRVIEFRIRRPPDVAGDYEIEVAYLPDMPGA